MKVNFGDDTLLILIVQKKSVNMLLFMYKSLQSTLNVCIIYNRAIIYIDCAGKWFSTLTNESFADR